MIAASMRRFFNAFVYIITLYILSAPLARAAYIGEIETGLQFVEEDSRTKYHLYIPRDYSLGKRYPLVLAIAESVEDTEAYANQWIEEAEKQGVVVVVPEVEKVVKGSPAYVDKWLFELLTRLKRRYNIDREKVLLTGFGSGADYVFYLALRYPKNFSAAAAVGGGLTPDHEAFVFYRAIKRESIPFLVMGGQNDPALEKRALSGDSVRETVRKLTVNGVAIEYQEKDSWSGEYEQGFTSGILEWFNKIHK